jgi:hypothetical protein
MKMKIEVVWKIDETLHIEIDPEEYNQIVSDSDGNKNLIALALDSLDKKRWSLDWRQAWAEVGKWGGRGKGRKWKSSGRSVHSKQLLGMKILEE